MSTVTAGGTLRERIDAAQQAEDTMFRWSFDPAKVTPPAAMTLRQKVGQLIMIEVPGAQLMERTARFIQMCHPAGVAMFGRNLAGPWATKRLISGLQAVATANGEAPLVVGIDQEGGQVSRLRYPLVEMPSNMACNAAGGAEAAGRAAAVLGAEMAQLGINLSFAPVVDVNTNPVNPVIGTRAYSDDPAQVAACAVAAIEGLRGQGVLSMAKHFPGHGATRSDSHLSLPSVTRGSEQMGKIDLLPFRAAIAAEVDSICTAHVRYPAIDPSGLPATLSPLLMTRLLREELGFEGALFTDALVMDAIARRRSSNIPPAAVAAVQAGVDCVMVLGSLRLQRRVYNALLAAVESGAISEDRLNEAVARMHALRLRVRPPAPLPALPEEGHQQVARELARDSVTLVRDAQGLLPLQGAGLGVVEFASGTVSPIETARNEPIGASTLALLIRRAFPATRFLALQSTTPHAAEFLTAFLGGCERVLVVSRSAALDARQALLLRAVAECGKPVVHLALRSPYDVSLTPRIGTALVTYGEQIDSAVAAVDVLLGLARPRGRLPINLDVPPEALIPEPEAPRARVVAPGKLRSRR
jgi:beta-N-acetylhexosaminidase